MPTNNTTKGIDVRQTGTALIFDGVLQSSAGTLVTSGTTNLYIWEVQSDGSINTYDFASNTFKAGAVTTEAQAMAYRRSNNGTTDTGYWTFALATLTGFTVGAIYCYRVNNAGASPLDQVRKFQFGSAEGDLVATAIATGTAQLQSDLRSIRGTQSAGVAGYVAPDGTMLLGAPRDLTAVPDNQTMLNDSWWAAVAGAAGQATLVDTVYTVKTSAGTQIRQFTLDSATAPTSRT